MDSRETLSQKWHSDPEGAFIDLVTSHDFVETGRARYSSDLPVRETSMETYRFMFVRYLKWLTQPATFAADSLVSTTVPSVTPDQVSLFLDEVSNTSESENRWRYLRLLERVYEFLVSSEIIDSNPVTEIVKVRMNKMGRKAVVGQDGPTVWLPVHEQDRLTKTMHAMKDSRSWKDARDAALAAALIGAGLKMAEALELRTDDVILNRGRVVVDVSKGCGTGRSRRALVETFVSWALIDWVERCEEGSLLFPGTKGSADAMDPATAYRRLRKLAEDANIDARHFGGRALRSSFAVRLLQNGTPADKVGDILGLQESKSLKRYINASEVKPKKPDSFTP